MDKRAAVLLLLPLLFSTLGDESPADRIVSVMCDLYFEMVKLIPVLLLLAVVFAALIYIGSQFFGAETKAKGSSMVQSILIGVIVTIIILLIAPHITSALLGQDITTVCGQSP